MKYMILVDGSQRDYDSVAGRAAVDQPAWSAEDFAALGAFMESFTKDLAESGELVDTRGLTRIVRRLLPEDGEVSGPRRAMPTSPRPSARATCRSSVTCMPGPPG
jgi:hypothetical protein